MKKWILFLMLVMFIPSVVFAQDEEWIRQQEQMIAEGYATIFDTDAYKNGDYVILPDGRVAIDVYHNDSIVYNEDGSISIYGHPTTEEERQELERINQEWDNAKEGSNNMQKQITDILMKGNQRIDPLDDIGLFVDPDLFWQGLQEAPVYDYIYDQETLDYLYNDSPIISVHDYLIEGGARIRCYINQYQKIHGIKIILEPWYLLREDCFEDYQLAGYVLAASGLATSNIDLDAVEAVKDRKEGFLAYNYYLSRYVEDGNLTVEIRTVYENIYDITPYNIMGSDTKNCDSNYVGACIPIVSYDLDCQDVPNRNFYVTGTDKHNFDADGNGVCCEPYPVL